MATYIPFGGEPIPDFAGGVDRSLSSSRVRLKTNLPLAISGLSCKRIIKDFARRIAPSVKLRLANRRFHLHLASASDQIVKAIMDFEPAQNIQAVSAERVIFSVCSLVTRDDQYQKMLTSFLSHGFDTRNSEFFYIDNRRSNEYEAYEGLNAMLAHARGRYVICCHQDVELIGDGAAELLAQLEGLTIQDPTWAVAGNAGLGPNGPAYRISDPFGDDQDSGSLPSLVHSLDENFLVLRNDARLGFSSDLHGFHLYGTDICLQADLRGFKAYVIDFHLRHYGRGTVDQSYFDCLHRFEEKYKQAFRTRKIRTSVRTAYITTSPLQTLLWQRKKNRRLRNLPREIKKCT